MRIKLHVYERNSCCEVVLLQNKYETKWNNGKRERKIFDRANIFETDKRKKKNNVQSMQDDRILNKLLFVSFSLYR